jgi:tRNA-dihydrouridine synthase A
LEANFEIEEPLVLQLGGSDPSQMKAASAVAYSMGYREININCGCPSEKVADAGSFGAALMLQPDLVSELSLSVGEATGSPATVKCRIGVDELDSYEFLSAFVHRVSTKGAVGHFIVHARKAVLGGKFSPADNRKIPPLKYEFVHRLVQDFPHLQFTINGGINSLDEEEVSPHFERGVAGVMIGRSVINDPFRFRHVDSMLYGNTDQGSSS